MVGKFVILFTSCLLCISNTGSLNKLVEHDTNTNFDFVSHNVGMEIVCAPSIASTWTLPPLTFIIEHNDIPVKVRHFIEFTHTKGDPLLAFGVARTRMNW